MSRFEKICLFLMFLIALGLLINIQKYSKKAYNKCMQEYHDSGICYNLIK